MTHRIDSFLKQWADAERAGDTKQLESLLTEDFTAVGPVGFILPKPAWLARYGQGGLAYETFELDEVQTLLHGDVAVVTARQNPGAVRPASGYDNQHCAGVCNDYC